MGLPEGTVRSWLGHLRKSGYLEAVRLNGKTRVTIKRLAAAELVAEPPATPTRFFTIAKIQRALGEDGGGHQAGVPDTQSLCAVLHAQLLAPRFRPG